MKQYIDYHFFRQQILLVIGLSMIPGLVYVIFGWLHGLFLPAVIWYTVMTIVVIWGYTLYQQYMYVETDELSLDRWYRKFKFFTYTIFALWTSIFIIYAPESESHLDYIAIFTQLGASVVASALLVSDRKLFVPILLMLILPLTLFFILLGTWYGYVLAFFSLIYVSVLLYASNNTYNLIQKTAYESRHDVLTGLYNRRFFIEYMDRLLSRLKEKRQFAYMFLIDLDHFKTINDSLGHDIGDKLLQRVSGRIESFAGTTHVVARIGGDEFAMVSKEMEDRPTCISHSSQVAQNLLEIIKRPYIIDGHHLYLSASIGISYIDRYLQDTDAGNYIKEADIAMYEVKAQGRDGVIRFDRVLSDRIERELEIEKKLYFAFADGEIELYFQPIFDRDKRVCGCEVLSRWSDSELGDISPNIFIAMAEKTGLIIKLGNYILKESFKTLAEWEATGGYCGHFSVNISARQLLNTTFVEDVKGMMTEFLPEKLKSRIYFEVTESILVEDIPKAIRVMKELKKLGIYFSMDDFGTGYSSLSYLRELPVDELKIDGSFVRHMGMSREDETMVKTILSIAKTFDLKVVAEGVETKDQYDFLVKHGCDLFQGFYFDAPLEKEAFYRKYVTAAVKQR